MVQWDAAALNRIVFVKRHNWKQRRCSQSGILHEPIGDHDHNGCINNINIVFVIFRDDQHVLRLQPVQPLLQLRIDVRRPGVLSHERGEVQDDGGSGFNDGGDISGGGGSCGYSV